jgi:hypothetical protein
MEPNPTGVYEGWPAAARVLVEKAVASHGGENVWRSVGSVKLSLSSISGVLLSLKGHGRTFTTPRECDVRPHERVTIFHKYPDAQHQGRFANGSISIQNVAEDRTTISSSHHRNSFRGLAKNRRWNHLDALYFFGYALWHYHVLPFALGEARFVRLVRHHSLEGVEVEFAGTVHTHCRRQRFFFGEEGRIARHDYVAEVIGKWARDCHFWDDYQSVGGIQIARRRRVVARLFGGPTRVTVLQVDFDAPSIEPQNSGRPASRPWPPTRL